MNANVWDDWRAKNFTENIISNFMFLIWKDCVDIKTCLFTYKVEVTLLFEKCVKFCFLFRI